MARVWQRDHVDASEAIREVSLQLPAIITAAKNWLENNENNCLVMQSKLSFKLIQGATGFSAISKKKFKLNDQSVCLSGWWFSSWIFQALFLKRWFFSRHHDCDVSLDCFYGLSIHINNCNQSFLVLQFSRKVTSAEMFATPVWIKCVLQFIITNQNFFVISFNQITLTIE